jgi:3-dehydroquinate dehydratase-2
MIKILILNGPNLNLLGTREPDIYGTETLESIMSSLADKAEVEGYLLESYQTNAEHKLVERIHAAANESIDFIVINPAAFTHTSVALRDALLGVAIPFIEVHLSNVSKREDFRKHSYFSDIAVGIISGFGAQGYDLALQAALAQIQRT